MIDERQRRVGKKIELIELFAGKSKGFQSLFWSAPLILYSLVHTMGGRYYPLAMDQHAATPMSDKSQHGMQQL